MNQISLPILSNPQGALNSKKGENRYVKPCCSWRSSTKRLLSDILDKNLSITTILKSFMETIDNTFQLENHSKLKLGTLNLSTPLIFKKISIHKIVEVDENLPDDELYPPLVQTSIFNLDDTTETTEKNDQISSKMKLEQINSFECGLNVIFFTNLPIDDDSDGDSEEEIESLLKSRFKRAVSKNSPIFLQQTQRTTTNSIHDLLEGKYKKRLNQISERKSQQLNLEPIKKNVSSRNFPEKFEPPISSKRRSLMERIARK